MKIGLISDIHANLPALESVIEHAEQNGITEFWNLGDNLGYGAYPEEVTKLLIKKSVLSILGNYDNKVIKVPRKRLIWPEKKVPVKWKAFDWAYENISQSSIDYYKRLPKTINLLFGTHKVLLCHGSPSSNNEPIYKNTPAIKFHELIDLSKANILLCGHTHESMVLKINNAIFINPGSVGRQHDGDPRASYSILTIEEQSISIEQFRIPYDIIKATNKILESKQPYEFVLMTILGRDLDSVKKYIQIEKEIHHIQL